MNPSPLCLLFAAVCTACNGCPHAHRELRGAGLQGEGTPPGRSFIQGQWGMDVAIFCTNVATPPALGTLTKNMQ